MTIENVFHLLDDLACGNAKGNKVILADTVSTSDIIIEYIKQRGETFCRLHLFLPSILSHQFSRTMVNSKLLFWNLEYFDEKYIEFLSQEFDDSYSIVFVGNIPDKKEVFTEWIKDVLDNVEIIQCFNSDALTVGELIDKLNKVEEKSATFVLLKDHYPNSFPSCFLYPCITDVSPYRILMQAYDKPFTVESILALLSQYNPELSIDFNVGIGTSMFAHHDSVNIWERNPLNKGALPMVSIDIETPDDVIKRYLHRNGR